MLKKLMCSKPMQCDLFDAAGYLASLRLQLSRRIVIMILAECTREVLDMHLTELELCRVYSAALLRIPGCSKSDVGLTTLPSSGYGMICGL